MSGKGETFCIELRSHQIREQRGHLSRQHKIIDTGRQRKETSIWSDEAEGKQMGGFEPSLENRSSTSCGRGGWQDTNSTKTSKLMSGGSE